MAKSRRRFCHFLSFFVNFCHVLSQWRSQGGWNSTPPRQRLQSNLRRASFSTSVVHTDRGTAFHNELIEELLRMSGTEQSLSYKTFQKTIKECAVAFGFNLDWFNPHSVRMAAPTALHWESWWQKLTKNDKKWQKRRLLFVMYYRTAVFLLTLTKIDKNLTLSHRFFRIRQKVTKQSCNLTSSSLKLKA